MIRVSISKAKAVTQCLSFTANLDNCILKAKFPHMRYMVCTCEWDKTWKPLVLLLCQNANAKVNIANGSLIGAIVIEQTGTLTFLMQASHSDEVHSRWTHDGHFPSAAPSGIFLACQRFPKDTRSWCRCRRNTTGVHTMAYDAFMNGSIFSWCFHFRNFRTLRCLEVRNIRIRVSIGDQLRRSVRLAITSFGQ